MNPMSEFPNADNYVAGSDALAPAADTTSLQNSKTRRHGAKFSLFLVGVVFTAAFVGILLGLAMLQRTRVSTNASAKFIQQILPWESASDSLKKKEEPVLADVSVKYNYRYPTSTPLPPVNSDSNDGNSRNSSNNNSLASNGSPQNTVKPTPSPKNITLTTDIVVYGGGAGGVMTAYQAAVMGKRVIVIEPTEWLGGQTSASGVGPLDAGRLPLDLEYGAIPRWLGLVKQIYRERGLPADQVYAGCHWNWEGLKAAHACPDPYIANLAYKRLLNTPETGGRVQVLYDTDIYDNSPLLKSGNQIVGIRVRKYTNNTYYTIRSKVVVDSSEYGDLIPYSGAAFIIRWGPWFHNKSQALAWAQAHQNEVQTKIQDITHVADLRLVNSYLPSSIRSLYQHKIKDLYPNLYPTGSLLSYYRSKVTTGTNQDQCVYYGDIFAKEHPYPLGFYFHARYRATGDPYISHTKIGNVPCKDSRGHEYRKVTKFELNMANDYSVNALFLLDRNIRHQETCQAKIKTLKYASYLEELPLPNGEPNKWYLARENHTCTSTDCYILHNNCTNVPDDLERAMYPIPYVRESIRPAGLININSNNPVMHWNQVVRVRPVEPLKIYRGVVKPSQMKPDSVGVGVYGFDLHDSTDDVHAKVPKWYWWSGGGYFQLPLGVFIPTDGQRGHPHVIKGFLVGEKNLAVDRYIQGSIRIHPSVMLNGQTVGILASLAADYNGDTSRLKPAIVQNIITSPQIKGKISPYVYRDIDYTKYSPEYRYSELSSTLGIFIGNTRVVIDKEKERVYFYHYWLPHRLLMRSEIAVVLQRFASRIGIDLSQHKIRTYHDNFKDIKGSWAEQAIIQDYEAGLTNGCTTDKFCPGRNVTMNEEIAFYYRLLKLKPGALNQRVTCTRIELPRTVTNWIKPSYIALIRAGVLPVQKNNGVCKVEFLVEKCGSNYNNCLLPSKPLDRMDTARLMWDIYYALEK